MTLQSFITMVKKECKNLGVEFYRSSKPGIAFDSDSDCNGFFQEGDSPVLAIATGKKVKDWLPVLVHEYSHMQQWKEQSPLWLNSEVAGIDVSYLVELWILGEIELNKKQKDKIFSILIECEADCERRAIAMIKKYNLPIDAEECAQRANSYILFYHYVRKNRTWYTIGKEPYNNPKVYKKMPKEIVSNPSKVSNRLLKAFD